MADDLAFHLGDQRHPDVAAFPEGIHEPGLGVLAEGEAVDVPDGVVVSSCFGPDSNANASLPKVL